MIAFYVQSASDLVRYIIDKWVIGGGRHVGQDNSIAEKVFGIFHLGKHDIPSHYCSNSDLLWRVNKGQQ